MANKVATYAERIAKSKEVKDQEAQAYQVEQASIQATQDVFQAKVAVAKANKAFEDAMSAIPFDSKSILKAKYDLEDAEDNLETLTKVKEDLFPSK